MGLKMEKTGKKNYPSLSYLCQNTSVDTPYVFFFSVLIFISSVTFFIGHFLFLLHKFDLFIYKNYVQWNSALHLLIWMMITDLFIKTPS